MENCRFVFYNNIGMFWCSFPLNLIGESRAQERKKQIVLSSQTAFLWSVLLSKITLYQSVCENRLVTVKKELTGEFKPTKKVALIAGAKRWRGGGRGRGRGGGEGGEGEKREQGKWKRALTLSPQSPYLFPSFQSPTTFDACYAGYQKSRNILNEQ